MAANNIGKWSVQAGIDAQGITSGVDRIGRDAMRMEQRVNQSFRNMRQQTASAMAGMGSSIAAGIPSALGIGSIGAVAAQLNSTLNDQIDLGFLNEQLGTSIEWLSAFRTVAMENSVSAEQFATGMNRLNMTIGAASLGGTEAIDTFRQLGINFDEFRGLSFDRQFMQVANALSQVSNRAERARLAMELFGRGEGQRMLRSLQGGAQGLAQSIAEVQARGGFTSEADMERFREMDNAIDRMTTAWSNAWRDFLGTIAPAATEFFNRLVRQAQELRTILSGGQGDIGAALGGPLTPGTLGPLGPSAMAAQQGFNLLPESAQNFAAEGFDLFTGMVGQWIQGNFPTSAEALAALQAGDLSTVPALDATASPANAGAAGVINNANLASIDQLNQQLLQTTHTAGMSAGELHMFRLRMQGATADQLDYAQSIIEASEAQQAFRHDLQEANRVWEAARNPVERFRDEMGRLQRLSDRGLIDQDAFAAAAAGAFTQLASSIADSPMLGAMEQGSREAAEIIANASNPQLDVQQTILAVQEAALREQQDNRRVLEQILDALAADQVPAMPPL